VRLAAALLSIATLAGLLDRPQSTPPVTMGEYRVIAGDFHVHMFPSMLQRLHRGTLSSKRVAGVST
jgi:hypothetical protein